MPATPAPAEAEARASAAPSTDAAELARVRATLASIQQRVSPAAARVFRRQLFPEAPEETEPGPAKGFYGVEEGAEGVSRFSYTRGNKPERDRAYRAHNKYLKSVGSSSSASAQPPERLDPEATLAAVGEEESDEGPSKKAASGGGGKKRDEALRKLAKLLAPRTRKWRAPSSE